MELVPNAEEVCVALKKFGEACVESQKALELTYHRQKSMIEVQPKFGKGDRRKNKSKFNNQLNRKR